MQVKIFKLFSLTPIIPCQKLRLHYNVTAI